MNRLKGHALKRHAWDEEAKGFSWSCECGQGLGVAAVHAARKLWREHKERIAVEGPSDDAAPRPDGGPEGRGDLSKDSAA